MNPHEPWYAHMEGWSRRKVNAAFRQRDESEKWPVSGRFNVTERAIRCLRRLAKMGHYVPEDGVAYAGLLEVEISNIVNNPARRRR